MVLMLYSVACNSKSETGFAATIKSIMVHPMLEPVKDIYFAADSIVADSAFFSLFVSRCGHRIVLAQDVSAG